MDRVYSHLLSAPLPPVGRRLRVDSGRKGKIAAAEWPSIRARHRRGESLASIARAYGCTAPAIAYIVKRPTSGEGGAAALPDPRTAGVELLRSPRGGFEYQLRERVRNDIAAFVIAFEAACEELTVDTRQKLLESADRLALAGARTRIALERWVEERSS
jgi:hypothetical protein